jgi:hypothetical protein
VSRVRAWGGRFLKHDKLSDTWSEVGNEVARSKASQAMREMNTPEARAAKGVVFPDEPFEEENKDASRHGLKYPAIVPTVPTMKDVLLGRGGHAGHHQGNKYYRKVKGAMQFRYLAATTVTEKMRISQELVDIVLGRGGRFLKHDKLMGIWYEITNDMARLKAGQALREINTPEGRAAKLEKLIEARVKARVAKLMQYGEDKDTSQRKSVSDEPVEEEDDEEEEEEEDDDDDENPYGQEEENPYGQEEQNPYRQEEQNPYRQEEQNPYRQEEQNPYRQEIQNPYRQEIQNPYQQEIQNPYRQEIQNPYRQEIQNPYRQEIQNPYGLKSVPIELVGQEEKPYGLKNVPIELVGQEENPYGLKNLDFVNDVITPTEKDVLLGRGGHARHHEGTLWYLKRKADLQDRYFAAETAGKTKISQELVDIVRGRGGRFLKYNKFLGRWYEVENAMARGKASQALREVAEVCAAKRARCLRRAAAAAARNA